jgi:hypothetical protein
METLILETTAPFQGLPELVAYDEGLFKKEGLDVRWADRKEREGRKEQTDILNPAGLNPLKVTAS